MASHSAMFSPTFRSPTVPIKRATAYLLILEFLMMDWLKYLHLDSQHLKPVVFESLEASAHVALQFPSIQLYFARSLQRVLGHRLMIRTSQISRFES